MGPAGRGMRSFPDASPAAARDNPPHRAAAWEAARAPGGERCTHDTDNGAARALARLGLTGEDVALIGRLPLFGGIGAEHLARLLAGAAVRLYERGTLLFLQGEAADRFFVVLDG